MWVFLPNSSESSRSVPEWVDSIKASHWLFQALSQKFTLKGRHLPAQSWLRACKKVRWLQRLCGVILAASTEGRLEGYLTLLREEFRANPGPWPANAAAQPTSAGSGTTSSASSRKSSRNGSSSRTCRVFANLVDGAWRKPQQSLFEEAGPSTFSGTWPATGGMRNGSCFLREPVVLPKSETDSSCSPVAPNSEPSQWMTPNVPNGGRAMSAEDVAAKGPTLRGKRQVPLEGQADLWATPRASESENRTTHDAPSHESGQHGKTLAGQAGTQVELWATPTSHERTQAPRQVDHGEQLANQADTWQTPTATDSKNRGYTYSQGDKDQAFPTLVGQAQNSLWPTPDANVFQDGEDSQTWLARRERLKETAQNGNGCGTLLAMAASLWNTPTATDYKGSTVPGAGRGQLSEQTETMGETQEPEVWPTPNAEGGTGYMSGSNRDTWRPTLEGAAQGLRPVLHQGRPVDTISCHSGPQVQPTLMPGESFLPAGPNSPQPDVAIRLLLEQLNWPCEGSEGSVPTLSESQLLTLRSLWLALQQKHWKARLSPEFVSWLMNIPICWVRTAPTPSERLEMQSYRSKQQLLLQSLLKDWVQK